MQSGRFAKPLRAGQEKNVQAVFSKISDQISSYMLNQSLLSITTALLCMGNT